ncbi:DUF4091 domain-containing protein [Flagellimonas pacifica]|uniref:Uncharacterized protein n=1 Tax=Flagellimonas pacifica TaxID=1247520 RepID=A0A285MQP1_9FLAO|nr:DUF4091 domain-containing protein [Allomuricauda parva]SNY99502.1 protein of unknown function [Allomuricauda parva]
MLKLFDRVRVVLAVVILINLGCSKKQRNDGLVSSEIRMDDISHVPEWLKLNVDEVFDLDSLNVWVPTGNFQTSSLIRVPRFPRKYLDTELIKNVALRDFQISNLADETELTLEAVKNEQISAQIALGSKNDITGLSIAVSDLIATNGNVISQKNFQVRYVKYLPIQRARSEYDWSPKLENIIGEGVSGNMAPDIVGDALMEMKAIDVPAYRAQPIWFTLKIPKNTEQGEYEGAITLSSDQYADRKYKLKLIVNDQEIPDSKDYKFHLDLWLNPSVIAEYYELPLWSESHWEMISKHLKDYASRGGRNLATTITHEPWLKPWIGNSTRSQIEYGYHSMVEWIRSENGEWKFDYKVFDKYVALAMHYGIDGDINAFSMAPFKDTKQKIHFLDKKDNLFKDLELDIHDDMFESLWIKFLSSFKEHLISKDLMERTFLGFDEKPEEDMKILLSTIEKTAPEFLDRIMIAGHPGGTSYATNLSISYMFFPEQPLEHKAVVPVIPTIGNRTGQDKRTTFYLCAEPAHPNALTYSPAVESQLIPWLALKYNTDGYLRWSYNNWTKDPFKNPVFRHNQGDDYYVYPGKEGPISSIRWELLKEGIEDYELYWVVKQKGKVSIESLNKAIEFATRNEDGRYKTVEDLYMSRSLLIERDKNAGPLVSND